jgi:hypothetical protein
VTVANLGHHLERAFEPVDGDPINLFGYESLYLDLSRLADNHGIATGIERGDVERTPGRQTQTAALADREIRETLVLAQHPAASVDDRPRPEGLRDAPAEKAAIVIVRDETDLLALRLVMVAASPSARA